MQSLDPVVQKAINRVQSYEETADAVGWLREAGIEGINLDLIYGLPHQTVASSIETVNECLALEPDRIAVFGYAHVPSFKKHQRRIDAATLPDGEARNTQAEAIGETPQGRRLPPDRHRPLRPRRRQPRGGPGRGPAPPQLPGLYH